MQVILERVVVVGEDRSGKEPTRYIAFEGNLAEGQRVLLNGTRVVVPKTGTPVLAWYDEGGKCIGVDEVAEESGSIRFLRHLAGNRGYTFDIGKDLVPIWQLQRKFGFRRRITNR